MSYEVLLVYTIVSNAMLLLIVIVQAIALSNHKCEIAYLREKVKDADQRAERAHRELMRKTGSGVGIAERERDGQRRVDQVAQRLAGVTHPSAHDYRAADRLRQIEAERISRGDPAPQAQGDPTAGIIGGMMLGHMLSGPHSVARAHDACVSPPQAPSVESTGPSPSCEAPSPSSSYDSSPSSSSGSGSSFSVGSSD